MLDLENYEKELKIIDIKKANVYAVLMLVPIVLVFGLPYYFIWEPELYMRDYLDSIGPFGIMSGTFKIIVFYLLGIVFHELIHGITWAFYAENGWKAIKFGVLWKVLTPYCHCKDPLKIKHYILGALTPAIVLGFIPSILSIIIGSIPLLIFGMIFIMAGGGDFMVVHLLRNEKTNNYVQDHPSEAGCYVYRK
jgi:hypothetical protein